MLPTSNHKSPDDMVTPPLTPPATTSTSTLTSTSTPTPTPESAPATTTTAETPSRAQTLTNVYSLATAFATCVEAFNLIHPHKDSDAAQKIALTKLGIQQSRLLIFGDAVGISAPPASIARHMVPSHPGLTNPDPTLPVNFGQRDARLDHDDVREKVTRALEEIYGRPAHLSRERLMEQYGLKQPKRFSAIGRPALDTNRLEAFREKYALLNDLMRQSGIRPSIPARKGSMALHHWTVKDVVRFDAFVATVRLEVDGLIALMGVKDHVDRGMRSDIKAMAWHPDLQSTVVRQDWEKLRLIKDAMVDDYPEYVEVAEKALAYLVEELRETKLHMLRAQMAQASTATTSTTSTTKTGTSASTSSQPGELTSKEKRPGFWSRISGYKSSKSKHRAQEHQNHTPAPRSLSDAGAPRPASSGRDADESNALTPVRSKSLSAVPDDAAPLDLDARVARVSMHAPTHANAQGHAQDHALTQVPTHSTLDIDDVDPLDSTGYGYGLIHADTANSLVERHDMFRGVGRIDTREIRDKSHEAAGW